MGHRLRVTAVSGAMWHEALTHRGGDARQLRRRGRRQARDGCQAKPAGDGAGAARGPVEGRNLPRRLTKRCSLRLPCCAECAFPSRCRSGGVGHNPPASLRGTMENGSTGQTCSSNPPPGWRGVAPGTRRPRPAGPASRKSAVWAEGLAESAPRVRPGHHQAASCGLRGCRELSITSLALSAPPAPHAPCPASSGRWALTPGSPPLVRGPLSRPSNTAHPALWRGCGKNID